MESSRLSLSHYIYNISANLSEKTLLDNLYEKNNILSKVYLDENLIILYNKFDNFHRTKLEMECRSVVIDATTRMIVCYSCPTPLYNIDALNYMWKNRLKPHDTFNCYEGSLLSLFNYKDTWYLVSKKCLYNMNSEETSHYKMFLDVIRQDGYMDINHFGSALAKDFSYHFVLIHHENNNIVDYKKQFGNNYMKLNLAFIRNIKTNIEYTLEEIKLENSFISSNIFVSEKIDYNTIKQTSQENITVPPESEGVIIKMNNQILKIQSPSYQFAKALGADNNIYRGFISLYQSNALSNYFLGDSNTENNKMSLKKLVNPTNVKESYDVIGMIDAIFKTCTSELYHLFNILYDNKSGLSQNNSLYKILPDQYKNILFRIKGLFLKNSKKLASGWPPSKEVSENVSIKDIYNLIKNMDTKLFECFLHKRKLMLNWLRIDPTNVDLVLFNTSLHHNEKVYYKMTTIYTMKLFPEIMPTDIPSMN